MRGKLICKGVRVLHIRITPADAGKTLELIGIENLAWDHPRGCGENIPRIAVENPVGGSPPQVRGKLISVFVLFGSTGITPAGAGKTTLAGRAHRMSKDHPRRCGENKAPFAGVFGQLGSPPQVRGKRL